MILRGKRACNGPGGRFCRDAEMSGLRSGARPEQDRGHPIRGRRECRCRDMGQARDDHRSVTLKGPSGRNDVDVESKPAECLVPPEGQFRIREVAPLRLDLGDPRGLIVENQRDRGLPGVGERAVGISTRARPEPPRSRRVKVSGRGGSTRHASAPGRRGLSPPEITDDLRPMGEGLPRPEAHHAGVRDGIPAAPNSPAQAAAPSPRTGRHRRRDRDRGGKPRYRDARSAPTAPVRPPRRGNARGSPVGKFPRGEIEVFEGPMIEFGKKPMKLWVMNRPGECFRRISTCIRS